MHPTSSFLAILALTPFLAVSAAPINTDGGALFIRGADADPVNYSDAYKMCYIQYGTEVGKGPNIEKRCGKLKRAAEAAANVSANGNVEARDPEADPEITNVSDLYKMCYASYGPGPWTDIHRENIEKRCGKLKREIEN